MKVKGKKSGRTYEVRVKWKVERKAVQRFFDTVDRHERKLAKQAERLDRLMKRFGIVE